MRRAPRSGLSTKNYPALKSAKPRFFCRYFKVSQKIYQHSKFSRQRRESQTNKVAFFLTSPTLLSRFSHWRTCPEPRGSQFSFLCLVFSETVIQILRHNKFWNDIIKKYVQIAIKISFSWQKKIKRLLINLFLPIFSDINILKINYEKFHVRVSKCDQYSLNNEIEVMSVF
jgi:hypothetical protein